MLSRKARTELQEDDKTIGSIARYARRCVRESVGNVRADQALARSIVCFVLSFLLVVETAAVILYMPSGWRGFLPFLLSTLAASLLILLWILAHVSLMKPNDRGTTRGLLLPNRLTIARVLLIAPAVVFLYQRRFQAAVLTYALCVLTDVIDGMLARKRGEITRFGVVMDPLADVFSTGFVFLTLAVMGLVPVWLFLVLLFRYLHLIVGSVVLFFRHGPIDFKATPVGKIVGVLQAIAVIMIILGAMGVIPAEYASGGIFFGVLGLVFGSVVVSQTLIGWKMIKAKVK